MKNARIMLCIYWQPLNSYNHTSEGKVDLVAERIISVSRENVNLKLVISLADTTAPDPTAAFSN